MIVSVNWLKKFTDIDITIDELTELIGSRLVEVEEVIDLGKKYEGIVIAKVVECSPLEGSDHLNVTKIDDGNITQDVERDENGLVQVVCGAPNVRAGLTVAWLPPNSTVPETHADAEPFVLGARKLRGAMSNGMLASAKELDLFEDHTGILELDNNKQAGQKFADAYELNDYLLDIENKSLTHRPDTFGIIGFAREVAGIQGKKFETPKRLNLDEVHWIEKDGDIETPRVTIDNPELSSRYQAVVLSDIDSKAQSPLETQTYLARIGVRPHSAVVDATNYLMMVTGQPLHAFDYDKLKAVNDGQIDIHVRAARNGERLALLDGREIELSENDIVIANGDVPVALAGAMGGRDTEIDDSTTNVLLESATFNLYNLRNTQMRHGIFSEAITRFTKGQPAGLTEPVLAEAVGLLSLSAGAKRASDVADAYPGQLDSQTVFTMAENMNTALGSSFSTNDIVETLQNVGFIVDVDEADVITVTVPYWRADIHIAEDIDEEVGRLNGYDAIKPTLPGRDFTAISPDSFDRFRDRVRVSLARAGANEVLTYSFVHGDTMAKSGQDVSNAYRIVNSISPNLQYYRLSLMPSLLSLVQPNVKAGFDSFALFELNKIHSKVFGVDEDGLPYEKDSVALIASGVTNGAAYFKAKRLLDYLGGSLGVVFEYKPLDASHGDDLRAPFDTKRSAAVYVRATGEMVGVIGEYKTMAKKSFKLGSDTAGFELDSHVLQNAHETSPLRYAPLGKYPSTERDVCFQVSQEILYSELESVARQALPRDSVSAVIQPLDIYQPNEGDTKNITFRIRLTPQHKTLSGDDVTAIINDVIQKVTTELDALVV